MIDVVEKRFWAFVAQGAADKCWKWTGTKLKKDGRGVMSVAGKNLTAPRIAWFVTHGEWPAKGLFVCHRCDNPACVNPAHLWLGSNADNLRDAGQKGRLWAQNDSRRIQGERHGNAKMTDADVRELRIMVAEGASQRAAAKRFGISQYAVWAICSRLRWAHV